MITPAPIIPSDVARTLSLSSAPDAKHIGYWRESVDNSDGHSVRAVASALRDLESFRETGRPPYYTGEPTDEAYFVRALDRARHQRDAAALLPWPADHCDPNMSPAERQSLAERLFALNTKITTRYCGNSWDRLDWPADAPPPWECFSWTNHLGSGEVVHAGYVWPEGLFRYVQRHGLVLPADFLAAVL